MNTVKVTFGSLFEVGQGAIVALTPEQVAPRRHRLEDVADGIYRVRDNVQFKGGEEIGIEGEAPKGQAHLVEVEPPPALEQSRNDDEQGFNTPKRGPARAGKR